MRKQAGRWCPCHRRRRLIDPSLNGQMGIGPIIEAVCVWNTEDVLVYTDPLCNGSSGNRCFFSIHRTPGPTTPRPSPDTPPPSRTSTITPRKDRLTATSAPREGIPMRYETVWKRWLLSAHLLQIITKCQAWYPKPFYHVETGFFPPEWLKPRPTKHAPTTSTHDNPPKVIQKPTEVPRTRRPFSGVWKALGLTTEQTVVPTPTQPATSTKQQHTTTVKVTTEKPTTTRPPTSAPSTAQAENIPQPVSTSQPPKTKKPVIVTTRKPSTTTIMVSQGTTTNKESESGATTPKLVHDKVTTPSQSSLITPTTALPPAMSTVTSQVAASSTSAKKHQAPVT
ncbi:hypothetical protein Bbelb_437710 [Branchiostoma belcheri]|nr:hypothetical protein Bbelb_437710 [Branchiostoma belcheri]